MRTALSAALELTVTSLQFHALLLFVCLDCFLDGVVKWRKQTEPRDERMASAVRAAAFGFGSACVAVMFLSEVTHPAYVSHLDAWPIWLFVGVAAVITVDRIVKAAKRIARARSRV